MKATIGGVSVFSASSDKRNATVFSNAESGGSLFGARALNSVESASLTALVGYVASVNGLREFNVARGLADRFDVPNVACLSASEYEAAIRYLVDQVPADVSQQASGA